ncbi:MAG: PQQ-binding-like beta-propeller repeat protein [Pirellulaceae bacterium]
MRCSILLFLACFFAIPASAEDWYRFRGPRLNGVSAETIWRAPATSHPLSVLWKQQVGTGLSGIVTSDGFAFTMGNRADSDIVHCLDALTGKSIWTWEYPCPIDPNEFEGGPTSTPTVDSDMLFTLSRIGQVHCFDKRTGQVLWKKHVAEESNLRVPGWGFAGSPLVIGNMLLLNIGEAGVALDKHSGETKWSSADKDAGYSSIVPIQSNGKDAIIFGSARSYVCVEATTGIELWRQRWLTTFGCNAADPIVSENRVFLSSGYNRGSALLDISSGDPRVIWKNKEMQNQISTSLLIDGFLYGIHGDVDAGTELRCMELATGEIKWTEASFQPSAIAAAGERLIIVNAEGELIFGKASSDQFTAISNHKVLNGKHWTSPVLSDGLLYCRSVDGVLVCFDLRTTKAN